MPDVKRVLVLTVGGSAVPLVKAMRESRADYFYFICSRDSASFAGSCRMVDEAAQPGQKCRKCGYQEPGGDSLIAAHGGIAKGDRERYGVVLLESPDSLEDCYLKALNSINEARGKFPGAEIVVDYTGGTKTMSAGLAMAGLDTDCEFALVKGNRPDLVKVKDGTERWGLVRSSRILLERQINLAGELASRWDFAAAARLLEMAGQMHLGQDDEDRLQRLTVLARALDAWDRFEFEKAGDLLGAYDFKALQKRLKKIVSARDWYFSDEPFHPKREIYCIVYDCLRNAERRAGQERYDDAAARLYRALEMYGQYTLRAVTGMRADEIALDSLPGELPSKYAPYRKKGKEHVEKNIAQLALDAVYRLLGDLAGTAGNFPAGCGAGADGGKLLQVGRIYLDSGINQRIKGALGVRNNSYLAHGFKPVKKSDYMQMEKVVFEFIGNCDKALAVAEPFASHPQMPVDLE